jgi:predicted nucleic acid-binding Zn ribbon protein
MTRSRRAPRPLTLALERIQTELAPQTLLADVQLAWRETVGDAIAAQAIPSAERGGVVTVSCSAAVWAQELDLMSATIVERLNERLGAGRVSRLRCVATPPHESWHEFA